MSTWLSDTCVPAATASWRTTPALGATTECSIFIASSTTSGAPLATLSPSATATLTTRPGMGAVTAPPAPATDAAAPMSRDQRGMGHLNSYAAPPVHMHSTPSLPPAVVKVSTSARTRAPSTSASTLPPVCPATARPPAAPAATAAPSGSSLTFLIEKRGLPGLLPDVASALPDLTLVPEGLEPKGATWSSLAPATSTSKSHCDTTVMPTSSPPPPLLPLPLLLPATVTSLL
mmetsp:Transcript_14121/g.34817  ORF Transcript_14121/g.34817 Transcript_14121/m.34817 type:complete len:232 (-) Transcript_14121:2122-2817(-)